MEGPSNNPIEGSKKSKGHGKDVHSKHGEKKTKSAKVDIDPQIVSATTPATTKPKQLVLNSEFDFDVASKMAGKSEQKLMKKKHTE